MTNNVTDITKQQLVEEGLNMLDSALIHFGKIESPAAQSITHVLHGLIVLGKAVYSLAR